MTAPADEAELRDRIVALIESDRRDDLHFDELARDIFRYQRAHCAAYRAWCDTLAVLPETVTGFATVPALPQEAWKVLDVSTVDPARITHRFRSSGTTAPGERSVQALPDTTLYDLSLSRTFAAGLFPDGRVLPIHALLPPPADAPDSSLVYMVGRAASRLVGARAQWYMSRDRLEIERAVTELRAVREAILLVGTASAFVQLTDALRRHPVRLPAGTRIMETGGYKGRGREVGLQELYAAIGATLGVPPERIVNQYGMCETSTQLYDGRAPHGAEAVRGKVVPPWARVQMLDPRTCAALPVGEAGLLCLYDAANLYTCAAILTGDLGRLRPDGTCEILGRARVADRRGCSLMVADLGVVQ